jgi:hypothetical protein
MYTRYVVIVVYHYCLHNIHVDDLRSKINYRYGQKCAITMS